jgi:hypothetical protein
VADIAPPAFSQLSALAARLAASHMLTALRSADGETWLGEVIERDTVALYASRTRAGAYAMNIDFVPDHARTI